MKYAAQLQDKLLVLGALRQRYVRWFSTPRIPLRGAEIVVYGLVLAVAITPALYLGATNDGVFLSHESAFYHSAEQFAEHGRLYVEDALTEQGVAAPTDMRGFVTVGDRAAPRYPPAYPLLLGVFHLVFITPTR